MAEQLGLSEIGQIALRVHDLDGAVEYYRERLGMALLFRVPGMVFFDCGGIRLLLGLPEGPEHDHPGSILYFKVADIGAAHEALAGRGVEFVEAPTKVAELESSDLWLAFFRDPWANTLALMSEVERG